MSGDESDVPQITTAADWQVGFAPGPGDDPAATPRCKPDYCLNVGITWPGLVALEMEGRVSMLSFRSFGAFIEGAAQRAESVGDTGGSSPQNWVGGFGQGHDHVLVTRHALSPEAMEGYTDRLCAWLAEGRAHTPRQSARPTRRWPGAAWWQQQFPPADSARSAGAVRLHPKSKDPLIGTQQPAESIFVIPQADGGPPIEVTGLSSFVTTKAAAYVFLPSVTAIEFIANLGDGP